MLIKDFNAQAQRIEPSQRSISSKEAGYNPLPIPNIRDIKDIVPLLNKVVQRTLKKGSFSV
jgi:hypothetical protein